MRPLKIGARSISRDICTLESFDVDLATSNPYGQVRYAALCLRGWVMSGDDMIAWPKAPSSEVRGFRAVVCLDSGVRFSFDRFGSICSDDDQCVKLDIDVNWEHVICFALYEYELWITKDLVDALVLQPSKTGAGVYVRIGLARRLQNSWFEKSAVVSTVTIV